MPKQNHRCFSVRIGVLAFFMLAAHAAVLQAAVDSSRFDVQISDLQLFVQGRRVPYESKILKPEEIGVGLGAQGKVKVLGGRLSAIYLLVNGSGSAVWQNHSNASSPPEVSWDGPVQMRPGESATVSVMAVGYDRNNRQERKITLPESVIHLTSVLPGQDYFDVEFKDVQLMLRGGPVPLTSRTFTQRDIGGGQPRVAVIGRILVKKGELLWLNALNNETSSTILQRQLNGPMPAGTEKDFQVNFQLDKDQPAVVSFSATAVNPEQTGPGQVVFYKNQVILTFKEEAPPKPRTVSPFKFTIDSRRLLVDSTAAGGTVMNFSDAQNGYVYETEKNSVFNVFSVIWTLHGGKVTKVEYTRDGNNWIEEKSLQMDPATRAVIGVSQNWNAKPGENFEIRVRVTGVDTDQDGNVVSAPRLITDEVSAKLSVRPPRPFAASFTRLYLEAGAIKSDFKSLPEEGIKITSQENVPVMLTAEWAVTHGKLLMVFYSIDGGRTWMEAEKRTGASATQAVVPATPGQRLDVVFKLRGQNTAAVLLEITDPAHARVSVERPKTIPLDAGFTNQAFYEEGGSAPLKYFSDLAGQSFEYNIAQSPARLEAHVTWWKKTGVLESVGVSFDGGKRWETTLIDPAKNFWGVSIQLQPGETQDIVFKLLGYDQDPEGRRIGPLKTITDTLHGKISGKGVGVPFQAAFKDPSVVLSGQTLKFSALPGEGFAYALDPKNPKIGIKTAFQFKGYLTILAISKDGGKTEWDSVVFQPGQAPGEYTFELPVASGDDLDLVFRIEGFDVDPWGRPLGQHKLITDSQHGKIKVLAPPPPPVPMFHDQGLGIGNDSIMFSTIPAEGLRITSDLPVPVYAWSELNLKGRRIKKGYFSLDGGKDWKPFSSASNSSISGEIGTALPGQKWDIVYKIETVALDDKGQETGPSAEELDEKHALLEITRPAPLDAEVKFSNQQMTLDGKDFPFLGQDPVRGLVYASGQSVKIKLQSAVSVPTKNMRIERVAFSNGKEMIFGSRTGTARDGLIHGELVLAPGQAADITFICEVQALDAKNKPIPGAVQTVTDTLHGKILIQKLPARPFKAAFTKKTVKIQNEAKDFLDIPAEGWTYQTKDPKGTAEYTVSWHLDSGYLKEVLCSTDGGTTWMSRVIGDDEHPDTHTFQMPFEAAAAPGNSHQAVCALKGVDADEQGEEVPEPKTLRDEQAVKINFVQAAEAPEIELSDIRIDGEPLEDVPPVIPMDEVQDGEILITGKVQSNVEIKELRVSFDGGNTWEPIAFQPQWEYRFKPVPDESYEAVFKAILGDGSEAEVGGYPKAKFRFSGPAEPAEDAEKVLQEMAGAYENKDYSGFMSRISDDFPDHGELEEFIRRDFRDFDGVKLNLFFKNAVDVQEGKSVEVDWEIRYAPASVATQVVARGQALTFIFATEDGRLKLIRMRGANPLFGARSPDVAQSAGVPSAVAETLRKIEDEGSRESKTTALNVVASEIVTSVQFIPLTFDIVDAFASYTDGAMEEVDFDAVQTGRPIVGEARIRILDNPKNIDVTGILLEITDSLSGEILTVTGDVEANQQVVFRTTDVIIFDPADAGQSGRMTFVLDPADKFIAIDRELKTVRQDYTLV